jgi:hypothetical protein
MSGASNFTETNIINALLRGVTMPLPSNTFVSLHTADPNETGANEVTTVAMPGYVRRCAENTGAIGTGWSAPTDGVSTNLLQLTFPSNNGPDAVVVTHFGLWDALSSGNCLVTAPLTTPRTLAVDDIIVFDVGSLTVTAT